jgi:phosphoglucosamine mutase
MTIMSSRRYFGTDGIRGVAGIEPMTAAFAFRVGVAAAETLCRHGSTQPTFVIGMDTRVSGPMLAHAVSAGLLSRGAHVVWLGVLPTPGVSYLTRQQGADAGVMISASHNPFEDNGIKLFNREGEKLSDELEQEIETLLTGEELDLPPVTGTAIGSSRDYVPDGDPYVEFLLSNAPYLDGLRVGLDCANGAAHDIAPRIFSQLGARLDVMHARPDGKNINVACGSTHPQAIQKRVRELGLDVGITFDGDADRALLVDKQGRLVTGDHMLAILAVTRREKTVVATLMSNLGLEHYLEQKGIRLLRTAVGDRYVSERLRQERLTLGGEQSGHMLLLDKAPTGDGLLTALQTLAAVRTSGRPLDVWMDEIPSYPQILVNVEVAPAVKHQLVEMPEVQEALSKAEALLAGSGRINLRPSGTEALVRIMVEGQEDSTIRRIGQDLAAVIARAAQAQP